MTALLPPRSIMLTEALPRSKGQGVLMLMLGSVRSVRLGRARDIGATSTERERMARWLQRERWKRSDPWTARSLWHFPDGSAFRERD